MVTIGRALHWMDRDAMAALLPRLVTPHGAIVVCSSGSAPDGRNGWLDAYNEAQALVVGTGGGSGTARCWRPFSKGRELKLTDEISVESSHRGQRQRPGAPRADLFDVVAGVLGDKAEAMLADVRQRLLPFSRDGMLTEIVVSTARVVRLRRVG